VALKLHSMGRGKWTLSRNNVPSGKLQRTRQSVILALADPECFLTVAERAELKTLVRNLIMSSHLLDDPSQIKAA
jgi:hypothetical protein